MEKGINRKTDVRGFGSIVKRLAVLSGLLFAMVLTLLPAQAQGAWYNPAWSGRTAVTVNNSGVTPLTNFQVKISLDSTFDYTKAKSDGSDVLVTNSTGTSLLPFWIETWNSSGNSFIWVKVDSLPVGSTTLYLYYGNAAATSASNGNNTFDFFDDFDSGPAGTTLTGYYNLVSAPTLTILPKNQGWETTPPHTLSVVQPDPSVNNGHTYWGYYGLQDCGGVGLAYSSDLNTWTKESSNPILLDGSPFTPARWPSVLWVQSTMTFYMLYEKNSDVCATGDSSIELATSTDGINFASIKTIVLAQSGFSNQNPNLFYNPNDLKYYIYWFQSDNGTPKSYTIRARNSDIIGTLDNTSSEVQVLQSYSTLAAPNMLLNSSTYFLSTEVLDGSELWNVQVYSSSTATAGFTLLPGNPVLDKGSSCMFQYVFGSNLHEYNCKLTGSTWTLEHRTASLAGGRLTIPEKAFDAGKWSATGGAWGIINDTQQDNIVGGVMQGFIGTNDVRQALLSIYSSSGSDYVLEAYGKQRVGRVWGLGVRATDQNNLDTINLYNDLDQDVVNGNLFAYNWTGGVSSTLLSAATGTVDANKWYKLKIMSHGNFIDVYKDDVLKLSTSDTAALGGKIALFGEKETVAEFNDVLVRQYADTEPSATPVYDVTAPIVQTFTAPATSTTKNIVISAMTATDAVGVSGYLITTTSTQPSAGDPNWTAIAPTIFTVGIDGTYTLYPWAKDEAGNVSAVSGLAKSVIVDTTVPTVTISTTASNPTRTTPIPVTATFSETVTGFTNTGVTVGNGTVTSFTVVSGTTYTFNVTPTANGLVTVDIAAGVAHDVAGNGNTVATQLSRTFDNTAPTVTLSTTASNPTRTTPIPVTATFSETVTGFTNTGVTVGNGTVTSFTVVSGTTYTFNVTPTVGTGTVTVDVAANATHDAAGNGNTAASQLSLTFDNIPPAVTISTTTPNPTNTSPIPVTVTFSEPVTGFSSGGVSIGNGTLSLFTAVSTTTYTFSVTPTPNTTMTVDISAGVAQDAAGNGNTVATQLSRTYDTIAPTVTISSTAPDPTNTSPIPFTATFSETVTGFTSTGVTVGNGTVTAFTVISGTTYSFSVTPSGSPLTVTVDVLAGVAHDLAGNASTAALQVSRNFDSVEPIPTMTSTAPNPTNTSPIPVSVSFSKAVVDFVSGSVTVTNGILSGFTGTGTSYSFNVAPSANGTVTVSIAAGVAHDSVGNGNQAAALTRTYDNIAPTATISSTASDPTNTTIPVTVTFSETVTGFTGTGVSLTNGTLSLFTAVSGTKYTFNVAPTANGLVTVNIAAGVAHDLAGNGNTAPVQLSRTYDNTAPTLLVSAPSLTVTNGGPVTYTVTYTGADNVTLANGNVTLNATGTATGSITTSGTGTVTRTVTISGITGNGTLGISIAAATASDQAGNTAAAAGPAATFTVDNTAPTVSISSPSSSTGNSGASVTYTVTYTGADTVSLSTGDVTLNKTLSANGSVAVSGSGTGTRTVTVSNITGFDGTLGISIAPGTASDLAGNKPTGTTTSGTFTVDNGSGSFSGGAVPDLADALKSLRFAAGLDVPTTADIAHGDVAPLLTGVRHPDGKIDINDVVAILRKVAGLSSW